MAGILLQIQGGSKWDTKPFIPYIAPNVATPNVTNPHLHEEPTHI
jgi:hypothetical protein